LWQEVEDDLLERFRFFCAEIVQRLILLSALALGFFGEQRHVTYAVR
jgi:hypothetical protein